MSEDKEVREQQSEEEVEDLDAKDDAENVSGGWVRDNAGRGPDWRQA